MEYILSNKFTLAQRLMAVAESHGLEVQSYWRLGDKTNSVDLSNVGFDKLDVPTTGVHRQESSEFILSDVPHMYAESSDMVLEFELKDHPRLIYFVTHEDSVTAGYKKFSIHPKGGARGYVNNTAVIPASSTLVMLYIPPRANEVYIRYLGTSVTAVKLYALTSSTVYLNLRNLKVSNLTVAKLPSNFVSAHQGKAKELARGFLQVFNPIAYTGDSLRDFIIGTTPSQYASMATSSGVSLATYNKVRTVKSLKTNAVHKLDEDVLVVQESEVVQNNFSVSTQIRKTDTALQGVVTSTIDPAHDLYIGVILNPPQPVPVVKDATGDITLGSMLAIKCHIRSHSTAEDAVIVTAHGLGTLTLVHSQAIPVGIASTEHTKVGLDIALDADNDVLTVKVYIARGKR